jgi:hypothetical protein
MPAARSPKPAPRRALALALAAGALLAPGCDRLRALAGLGPGEEAVPASPASEAKAEVVRVRDERVSGEGTQPATELLVRLPGLGDATLRAARVVVKTAVDDLGTSLLPRKAPSTRPAPESVAPGGRIVVALQPAPRAAKRIRELSVEVQVELAGDDPSSLVTVPRFLAETGTTIQAQALVDAGVEVRLVGADELAGGREAAAEAKRAEGERKGLGAELREGAARLAAEAAPEAGEGVVVLKVKDPKRRLRELAFLDGLGVAREALRLEKGGYTFLSCDAAAPQPDWGLVVRLKHARELKRYAFTLLDVPLP